MVLRLRGYGGSLTVSPLRLSSVRIITPPWHHVAHCHNVALVIIATSLWRLSLVIACYHCIGNTSFVYTCVYFVNLPLNCHP
jgi:hypothetical protein